MRARCWQILLFTHITNDAGVSPRMVKETPCVRGYSNPRTRYKMSKFCFWVLWIWYPGHNYYYIMKVSIYFSLQLRKISPGLYISTASAKYSKPSRLSSTRFLVEFKFPTKNHLTLINSRNLGHAEKFSQFDIILTYDVIILI